MAPLVTEAGAGEEKDGCLDVSTASDAAPVGGESGSLSPSCCGSGEGGDEWSVEGVAEMSCDGTMCSLTAAVLVGEVASFSNENEE